MYLTEWFINNWMLLLLIYYLKTFLWWYITFWKLIYLGGGELPRMSGVISFIVILQVFHTNIPLKFLITFISSFLFKKFMDLSEIDERLSKPDLNNISRYQYTLYISSWFMFKMSLWYLTQMILFLPGWFTFTVTWNDLWHISKQICRK